MFNFFQKKSIGLDIADHTIEAVELIRKAGKTKVLNMGRARIEPDIVEKGRIKNQEKLVEAVKQVFLQAKPKRIISKKLVFGLPESQVYTHVFGLVIKDKTVAETMASIREKLISEEAKKSIPVKAQDILFNYRILKAVVLDQKRVKIEILTVVTSREVVLEWQRFFQKLKIDVDFFDIETLAVFRGLFIKTPKQPISIIDIGAVTTTVSIFDKKDLRYSYSINIAGNVLTQNIAEELRIKPEQAEKLKIKNGISNKDKRIRSVITKILDPVVEEIQQSFKYFENKTNKKVDEIILVGGSSQLKGLVEYFKNKIDLSVRLGESALTNNKDKRTNPLFYIEAIGMGLRELNKKKWDKLHPVIELAHETKDLTTKDEETEKQAKAETEEIQPVKKDLKVYRLKTELQEKKARLQKVLLVIILIMGIVSIGLAFRFRKHEKERQKQDLQAVVSQYSQTQVFELKVPVAVDAEEYTNDRVKGRIIENTIKGAGNYIEALSNARILAEKELQQKEILWPAPLEVINKNGVVVLKPQKLLMGKNPVSPEPEDLVFPVVFKWLVYFDQEANKLFLKEIDKLNKDNIDYALNNIVKIGLELSSNKYIYFFIDRITISLNQLMQVPEEQTKSIEKIVEQEAMQEPLAIEMEKTAQENVLIQEVVNVRSGPGTNYSKIGRVYSGESYPLLQEQDQWYKIRIPANAAGRDEQGEAWIFSKYANKVLIYE